MHPQKIIALPVFQQHGAGFIPFRQGMAAVAKGFQGPVRLRLGKKSQVKNVLLCLGLDQAYFLQLPLLHGV